MKKYSDPRHQARIAALQLLFADEFNQDIYAGSQFPFALSEIKDLNQSDNIDENMVKFIYQGVRDNIEAIDAIINKMVVIKNKEHIASCDLAILRIAIFEGYIAKTAPVKVVIDEAVELAKTFGNNNSSNFVNGILGNIQKS